MSRRVDAAPLLRTVSFTNSFTSICRGGRVGQSRLSSVRTCSSPPRAAVDPANFVLTGRFDRSQCQPRARPPTQ